MKERPIIFSGPMVRALLDDKKTQTRRVIKPQPEWVGKNDVLNVNGRVGLPHAICPYGKPGDKLWVRESWGLSEDEETPVYRADYPDEMARSIGPWKHSIHMPRWASRITLEVTGVRVERAQDISGPDCWKEGIHEIRDAGDKHGDLRGSVLHDYQALWESINGTESWDANPWVWVISFKKATP